MTATKPRDVEITELMVMLTTRCNRHCCDCLVKANGPEHRRDISMDELLLLSRYFKGISCLHLSGGEPTLHEEFDIIVPKLRDMFDCEHLVMTTNGYGLNRYFNTCMMFDGIYVSLYPDNFCREDSTNKSEINQFVSRLDGIGNPTVHIGTLAPGDHAHIDLVPRGVQVCSRGNLGYAVYCDNKLYPCCVMQEGVQVGPYWREDLASVPMDCDACFMRCMG